MVASTAAFGACAQDAGLALARRRLVVDDGVVAEAAAHHEIVEPDSTDRDLVAARQVEDRWLVRPGQRSPARDDLAGRHAERGGDGGDVERWIKA